MSDTQQPDLTTLKVEIVGGIAEVILNRPELLNRFDADLHREFVEAFRWLNGLKGLRCVVLGSTGKVFSAGGDFEYMRAAHEDIQYFLAAEEEARELFEVLHHMVVPIVVALQGHAIGLAATIVLACDAVVAAPEAKIADPHVVAGLAAGDGGCIVWPQAAGMLRARRFLLTGDPVLAKDGYTMGLVTDLVDTADDVLPAARAIAERIASLSPLAVRGTKMALNQVTRQRSNEVLNLSLAYEGVSVASQDWAEAVAAFKERRPGQFQGR
jgi:enoyl-CoA hydratase